MTIPEFIEKHAPCLPVSTVRAHLKAGRNSAQLMLTYNPAAAVSAAAKRGRLQQARLGRARFGSGTKRFR